MDDVFRRSEQLLLQELPDLLGQMGFEVSRIARRAPLGANEAILGTIGFGGAHMRGALSMLADVAVWEAGCPAELRARAQRERAISDFVGEICNVVGGRFRSRLLRVGAEIACALPTTVYAWDITIPTALSAATNWYELLTPAGIIHLRYDLTVEEAFVLDEHSKVESLDSNVLFF